MEKGSNENNKIEKTYQKNDWDAKETQLIIKQCFKVFK